MKCENYTYLQEQAEESLEECSLATPQSQQSKSNHTAKKSCEPDSGTESCQSSQFLETSKNSMEDHGEAPLMFFVEDSRAKTSVQRVQVQELPAHVQDFGKSMRDSLEKSGLDLSLPKTHHCFGLGGLELSSKIWPRWGMMQGGECSELGTLVRPTSATGCGFWPTPCANKITASGELVNADGIPWDGESKPHSQKTGKPVQTALMDKVIHAWPTPTRRDWKGTNAPAGLTRKDGKSRLDQLPNAVAYGGTQTPQKGQLNPSWVEWLMGWPIGWTDLKPLETDRFRNVQQWHSEFYPKDCFEQ